MKINKPIKHLCPLADAQTWGKGRLTRKYDGDFEAREICGVMFAGQLMRPKSGGFFTALDRAMFAERREFWVALDVISAEPTDVRAGILEEYRLAGGIIAEDVACITKTMAAGAEGVCWQSWDWQYGEILAYKSRWEGVCRVSMPAGKTQSVEIEDAATGQARGRIALRGGRCDRVRVGSLLKVTAMCLTGDGKLREARLDADAPGSWLVKF
jgi:hypothetical protein